MKILLNATQPELDRLGGDFSLYRDWLRLSRDRLHFSLITNSLRRTFSVERRKVLEKSCRGWQPELVRRRLFIGSRLLSIPDGEAQRCDLVFSHLLYPVISALSKRPIIWSSQGLSPSVYYERANRGMWTMEDVAFMYGVLGKSADILLISTESAANNLVEARPELEGKVRVVHPPVFVPQDREWKPSEVDGEIRFLFVGVDAVRKGLPDVLNAFRQLRERHKKIRLDVVSRPSSGLTREITQTEGVHLHLSSSSFDLADLMRDADIFLIPTFADTYALASVEAMAHGCAVIISDLEPLPEVVPNGVAGLTVRAGDVPSLVNKMTFLLNTDRLRPMQDAARQLYRERNHPEVVANKLTAIFESVLMNRPGFDGASDP